MIVARDALRTLVLLAAMAIGCLLILEVSVRISGRAASLYTEPCFEWAPGRSYWRYKPGFEGWVLGPTYVRIGLGGNRLHGDDGSAVRTDVTIAVFGDSVTFGQAVKDAETFVARVDRALKAEQLKVSVLNFGVQGHTLEMILEHLMDRRQEVELDIVVLAFISEDLNPKRANNRVDRYGYLTKTVFGAGNAGGDFVRAWLRRSHTALLAKHAYLRLTSSRSDKDPGPAKADGEPDSRLGRFRGLVGRFEEVTRDRSRLVICLDRRESRLSSGIQRLMLREVPQVPYLHSPDVLSSVPLQQLRSPRDGHPNAEAHRIYAALLLPELRRAAQLVHAARSSVQE